MAIQPVYIDPINGNDSTGRGSLAAPWKTISYALAYGSYNTAIVVGGLFGYTYGVPVTIFCLPGIYRETIPQCGSISGSSVVNIIGLGLCIIDGESIRPCFNLIPYSQDSIGYPGPAGQESAICFANIVFRNPNNNVFCPTVVVAELNTYPGSMQALNCYNCSFYFDTAPGGNAGTVIPVTAQGATLNVVLNNFGVFDHCTFKNIGQIATVTNLSGTNTGTIVTNSCIVDVGNSSFPFQKITNTSGTYTATNTATFTAYPGGSGGGNVNITTTAPTYDVSTFPNPSLSLTAGAGNNASYIEQGANGGNIGAYWYPFFGQDSLAVAMGIQSAWTDMLGNAFITDPNYYNGTTQGTAVNVNDVGDTNHWEIDTQYTPTATSAAVLTPVMAVQIKPGATVVIRNVIRGAVENTAPAAGSKLVVNSTASATRTGQWRASTTLFAQTAAPGGAVPSWNDLAFTLSNSTTFTQTVYIQGRAILTIVGY